MKLDHWQMLPIGELASMLSGGTPSKERQDYWGGTIPWVTVKDMKSLRLNSVGEALSRKGAKAVRVAPEGSVLVLVRGMGLFKGLPVTLCNRPVAFNQDIKALVPNEGVDGEFLALSVAARASDILRHVDTAGHGTGRLDTDLLKSTPLPVPPITEQRKIAEILRTWDEALEKLTALRAAKLKRLDAVTQQLLSPSRAIGRGSSQSPWTLTNFGEIFKERRDKNEILSADDVVTVGKYAIRKQSEHFNRNVASKDLSNYWVISPGDFVYDPMSAYYGAIGRYLASSDGIVSPAYRVIRLDPGVDPEFVVALLRSHHIRFLLEARSSQGNKEGKRRLLPRAEFESIEFNLPSNETQQEIASTIALFQADLGLTEQEIECVTQQKRGLMQKLLTGEWRV